MIKFISIEESIPFQKFKGLYEDADIKNEKNIDAACISSLNKTRNEISSRFVNIKYIKENKIYFY